MNNSLRIKLLTVLAAISCACSLYAQTDYGENRDQWFKEVREYKHRYLAKELELSREQEQKFFPIYDKMEDDIAKLNNETRALERRISERSDVTDLEYDQATDALLEQKNKEYQIETEAFDKYETVLTKEQLFRLKGVERMFTREVMKFHHRRRNVQHNRR